MTKHNHFSYAEVAVDCFTPTNQLFTYSIPRKVIARKGDLVKVEFKNRILFGIIFEIKTTKPNIPEIKNIIQVIDGFPRLSQNQLQLSKWISDYYHSSIFKASSLLFPSNQNTKLQKLYFAPKSSPSNIDSDLEKYIYMEIIKTPGLTQEKIENKHGKIARNILKDLIKKDLIFLKEKFSLPNNGGKIELIKLSKNFEFKEQSKYLTKNSHKQKKLIEFMLNSPGSKTNSSLRTHFGSSPINSLIKKNILIKYSATPSRKILVKQHNEDIQELNETEKKISQIISNSIESNQKNKKIFLYKNGSANRKIQIYIEAIRNCLNQQKTVKILAPEISVANELFKQINQYFSKETILFNSNMSASKKNSLWWEIRQGYYPIIIGTQNSIFLPVPKIGLIILDEEHEDSYKNIDSNPKFDTRKIAEKLSELNNFTLILSSSTPRVESFLKSNFKKYELLEEDSIDIKHRKNRFHVINLNDELKSGNRSPISKELLSDITSCVDNKTQGMLFLNQRGSHPHVFCETCKFIPICNKCNIPINFHNDIKMLLCHNCGEQQNPLKNCPNCSNQNLLYRGLGTKKLCEMIQSKFPETKILRLDKDSTPTPDAKIKTLDSFQNGNAQFLIGTDMVPKGLTFPNVSLIGMIIGETGMHSSNFRSAEKIFQRIYNLSKIASKSKIIIQTYKPNFYPITNGSSQNYLGFFKKEILFRKTQNLPPYSNIIRLIYSNKNEQSCSHESKKIFSELLNIRNILNLQNIEVRGPTPTFPAKDKDSYKFQIHIRGKHPQVLIQNIKLKKDWVVDVDPVGI